MPLFYPYHGRILPLLSEAKEGDECRKDEKRITSQGVKNADVSGNDGMTTGDAVTIQKYLLRLISELPETK